MASWIAKPWIEQALMSRNGENLPKIARAQILKLEKTSDSSVAFISDKKLFVKAVFSQVAIEQFKRDNPGLLMADIQGGLIFIKKYSLQATCGMGKELDSGEFVVRIEQFKFAGGEGNTQFGSNVIDSSTYPPLQPRLQELCRLSQVRTLLHGKNGEPQGDGDIPGFTEIERTLLENHDHVFIPEDMEKKLVEIPEWKPSHCPPLSCGMQSEISSSGNTPSNGNLQVQTSVPSMAVDQEKYPVINEKRIYSESVSLGEKRNCSQRDNSQTTSKDKVSVEKTNIEKMICAQSEESLGVTKICLRSQCRQLESSSLSNKLMDVVSSIPTPEEQKQRKKTLTKVRSTDACMESREFNLLSNAVNSSFRSTKGEIFVVQSSPRTSEPEKEKHLNNQEKQESPNVCTANETKDDLENGYGPRMTANSGQLSRKYEAADCVGDISSQAKVLHDRRSGQSNFLEHQIKGKENIDSNSKFDSPQDEITVALIGSECVPSSQRSAKFTQPLRGLVTDEYFLSSETSHLKGNSEESYSILKKRSLSVMQKSPEVCIVPSSQNSEEFEQALPNLTPGCTTKERSPPSVMNKSPDVSVVPSSENSEEFEQAFLSLTPGTCTAKQLHCSLSESQLENLLETSISFDVGSAPPCFKDVSAESQEEDEVYTQIKQRESSLCCRKPGNRRSSPESSHLGNIAVGNPCMASNRDMKGKKSIPENEHKKDNSALKENQGLEGHKETAVSVQDHVIQTQSNALMMDFDALFSQNTWGFSQISDKELSANLVEIDRHRSVKRKRSEMDDHVRFTCPSAETRQGNKVHLNDSPVSPDSTSHSVKSSSHSGSFQSQLSNRSPRIYLTKPMDLYSQQDPLLLDTSAESADSTDGVIDNDSGLLLTGNRADVLHGNTTPSVLERSIEEPCTLKTPTFDSLPSYQVPAEKREASPSRDQRCKLVSSATRHQEAEPGHEPGTDKKRNSRRRKFDWFSDAF